MSADTMNLSELRASGPLADELAAHVALAPSEHVILALANLDPEAAAVALVENVESVTAALPAIALRRAVSGVAALGLSRERAVARPLLVSLAQSFPESVDAGVVASIATGATTEDDHVDALVAASLKRAPSHPGLLRVAAERAVRSGRTEEAHALLTRLARMDGSLAAVRRVWQTRASIPAAAGATVRMTLLGSYTLDLLVPYVDLECRELGLIPEIHIAPFNAWMQEILDDTSAMHRVEPEIAFLAVALDDLVPELAGAPSGEELARLGEMALDRVLEAARRFTSGFSGVLVVHAFHSAFRDPFGIVAGRETTSRSDWIASLNARLGGALRELPRAYLLDIVEVLQHRAGGVADNPKMRHLGALRLSEGVLGAVAREYARYIAPLKGLTRKCVVLDLDNTLWGGIIGEDGVNGIRLGDTSPGSEFVEFQQYLQTLAKRGFLLAVNSKNNPDDALEALRSHAAMVLREDAFSAVRINWQPKPDNMRAIAEELNIGVDSLVFVDDNPKERALMRELLPEVLTPEMPSDPALYRSTLEALPQLQTLTITDEDRSRAVQYRSKRQRESVRTSAASLDGYLRSLEIHVGIEDAGDATLPRVYQLFQRTNQFNVTTRRYELGDLAARAASHEWRLYTVRATDRFGDHGLVATALVHAGVDEWLIDSLLMSCRVIGYGVESALIATIVDEARAAGASEVIGEFIPTRKNAPARDFFERHGFRAAEQAGDVTRWRHGVSAPGPQLPSWIALERIRSAA